MISRVCFKATTSTTNLVGTGELLHGPLSSKGYQTDQYKAAARASLAANAAWAPWKTHKYGGYRSWDKKYTNHLNVIEFERSKRGYPGDWWMFQKSVAANDPKKAKYKFSEPSYLLQQPAAAGFLAY